MTRRLLAAVWAEVPAAWASAKTSAVIVTVVAWGLFAPYAWFGVREVLTGVGAR